MATATEVIATLQQRGVTLDPDGAGGLRVIGISRLSEQEKATLRRHKGAILRALEVPTAAPVKPSVEVWPPKRHGKLADIPEIPKGENPQPVECWTPSGKRLAVPAYSAEHATAIHRMNPLPKDAGDR